MRLFLIGYRWTGFFLIALGLILGQSTISAAVSQLTITWSDRSSNEDGFKIERRTATGTYDAPPTQVGANVTSFIDSTVTKAGTETGNCISMAMVRSTVARRIAAGVLSGPLATYP